MVRIHDVVNSETDNLYEQLAGGVTTVNLLHGSANPIGGQNCVIKLRDGASPEDLVFAAAPAGIKFALGENVKQSNWGEKFSKLPRTSFDYAVMEHADRVLVLEAKFDWDDVGGWQAVARYFPKDARGNAANCGLTTLEASDNIVFDDAGNNVALLGVNNLIVVRTRDAVLVCHRHHAEKIKNLVAKLPEALQ
jgi:hypothetical protein